MRSTWAYCALSVLVLSACGSGDSDPMATTGSAPTGANSVGSNSANNQGNPNALTISNFVNKIELQFGGEDAALDAFLRAISIGYSIETISDAVFGSEYTLAASGFISDSKGTTILPGLTLAPATVNRSGKGQFDDITGLKGLVRSWANDYGGSPGSSGLFMLLVVMQAGYTQEQIQEAFLFGYTLAKRTDLSTGRIHPVMLDERGQVVLPDQPWLAFFDSDQANAGSSGPSSNPVSQSFVWASNQPCAGVSDPNFAQKWRVTLNQNGNVVTGDIYFHACPGRGRLSFSLSGDAPAAGKPFVLAGTKTSGQGPIGASVNGTGTFTLTPNQAPVPNWAP